MRMLRATSIQINWKIKRNIYSADFMHRSRTRDDCELQLNLLLFIPFSTSGVQTNSVSSKLRQFNFQSISIDLCIADSYKWNSHLKSFSPHTVLPARNRVQSETSTVSFWAAAPPFFCRMPHTHRFDRTATLWCDHFNASWLQYTIKRPNSWFVCELQAKQRKKIRVEERVCTCTSIAELSHRIFGSVCFVVCIFFFSIVFSIGFRVTSFRFYFIFRSFWSTFGQFTDFWKICFICASRKKVVSNWCELNAKK